MWGLPPWCCSGIRVESRQGTCQDWQIRSEQRVLAGQAVKLVMQAEDTVARQAQQSSDPQELVSFAYTITSSHEVHRPARSHQPHTPYTRDFACQAAFACATTPDAACTAIPQAPDGSSFPCGRTEAARMQMQALVETQLAKLTRAHISLPASQQAPSLHQQP